MSGDLGSGRSNGGFMVLMVITKETKSEETVAFTGRLIYRYNESVNYESERGK